MKGITIYPDRRIIAALAPRVGTERRARTRVLARICARYAEICERELPSVPDHDMAFMSTIIDGACREVEPAYLDAIMASALELRPDIVAGLHLNAGALLRRIRSWSYAERVAVCDAIERTIVSRRHQP